MIFAFDEHWCAFIRESPYNMGYEIFLTQVFAGGRHRALQPDGSTLEVLEGQTTSHIQPFLVLKAEQIQALVDAAAARGVVANGKRYEQEMALVQSHLQDMRRLVFKGKP